MKKVLIVSPSFDEQKMIEEVAQHHNPGGLSIETTASFGQDGEWWTANMPNALIVHLPEDDLLQGYYFTKLRRDIPRTQPIIFLCSTISSALMQMSLNFGKVRMIKTPVEGFSLYRALIDLLREFEPGRNQGNPRYLTDQAVEVLSDFREGRILARMKNLSLSGAYFESAQRDFELAPGDFVKMSVNIGQPQRQYIFDAKVVWTKPQQTPGVIGYGVTFIDKEEVYNNLLKNI